MQIMPEKTNSEAPFPQQSRGFHGGKDVDIEGVTGSIPVTPTIRTPANQGLGQSGAKCPTGSLEPDALIERWRAAFKRANGWEAPRVSYANGWFVIDSIFQPRRRRAKLERMAERLESRQPAPSSGL